MDADDEDFLFNEMLEEDEETKTAGSIPFSKAKKERKVPSKMAKAIQTDTAIGIFICESVETTSSSFSYKRGLYIAGAALAAGVGACVAAPVVIPAAVGFLGFGSGGIAAGSWAAWMMRLGRGVTPAAVSVMQSIGATGLISGATAAGTGAATGGFAGAAAYMASRKTTANQATQTD